MKWEADDSPEDLIEVGRPSPARVAATLLTAFAALILAMLPVAVVLGAGLQKWVAPAMGSLAAVLSGTKVVAVVWGLVQGVRQP
jgi:hypothetical protein